jgi:lipopolysaccharide export system permease protein
VLYVGAKNENSLRGVWIWELDEDGRVIRLHRAAKGSLRYDPGEEQLVLTLSEGYSEMRNENDPDDLQSIRPTLSFREAPRIRFPLDGYFGKKRTRISYSSLNLDQLRERIQKESKRLEEMPADAAASLERQVIEKDIVRSRLQIQKNFAMAFSVLSLAIVGIPLGIRVGRKETHANIAIALALAMVYYFLIVVLGWLEKHPEWRPDLLVWTPNLIFQGVGVLMLVLAARK